MLDAYRDIRERIDEEPRWYDRHGVPRYCEFAPEHCSNVYASEVLLMDVACQDCGRRFLVEFTWEGWGGYASLSAQLAQGSLPHYGDPPRHDHHEDCVAGDTMNVTGPRVVGLWCRDRFEWEEVAIDLLLEEADIAEKLQQ